MKLPVKGGIEIGVVWRTMCSAFGLWNEYAGEDGSKYADTTVQEESSVGGQALHQIREGLGGHEGRGVGEGHDDLVGHVVRVFRQQLANDGSGDREPSHVAQEEAEADGQNRNPGVGVVNGLRVVVLHIGSFTNLPGFSFRLHFSGGHKL